MVAVRKHLCASVAITSRFGVNNAVGRGTAFICRPFKLNGLDIPWPSEFNNAWPLIDPIKLNREYSEWTRRL